MNINLLNKYDIKFINTIFLNENVKRIDSPNKYLNQFITDSRTVEEANDLLNAINKVCKGNTKKLIGISLTLLAIEITQHDVKLYDEPDFNSSDDPIFTMPTNDFKTIVEDWIEFLSSTPLSI
ncbi:hypothetical protein [Mucilaginibacter arboris]|uniref:Uncharacterized protein n=1 Tax=Mucilaginibacter arboris TaxID=2682090 RepID=A0A7K1SRK6_9SPHI|nr:hypothetical protein [Mucilaginibacter arboris]MVN19942.1 hypothetical protein [Mucilaginibacter arboris]